MLRAGYLDIDQTVHPFARPYNFSLDLDCSHDDIILKIGKTLFSS